MSALTHFSLFSGIGGIYVSKEDALKEFDADKMTGAKFL